MSRAWLLTDLTYGDAAKGATVDYLARSEPVHTVVRFNGGPQAGHNVVTPDGRHHTFSQFGSATFLPDVITYLSRYMLINPLNAFKEEEHLQSLGVTDAFDRMFVHPECLVITPFHVAANQIREIARGNDRHGSCGMGVGETVSDSLSTYPSDVLRADDLADSTVVARKLMLARDRILAAIRSTGTISPALEAQNIPEFSDPGLVEAFVEAAQAYAKRIWIAPNAFLGDRMRKGTTVFEPAQGTLLDEDFGFHPHTTWSRTTLTNAEEILKTVDFQGEIIRMGLIRAHSTRHGAGPFVTHDPAMTEKFFDHCNHTGVWQGAMRYGPLDLVATRYALAANPGIDRLAVSHLDMVDVDPRGWSFCRRYLVGAPDDHALLYPDMAFCDTNGEIANLVAQSRPPVPSQSRLTRQERLGRFLDKRCSPKIEYVPAPASTQALDIIEQELGLPVYIGANGPKATDRRSLYDSTHAAA